jgi:hypothetical protein
MALALSRSSGGVGPENDAALNPVRPIRANARRENSGCNAPTQNRRKSVSNVAAARKLHGKQAKKRDNEYEDEPP